MRRVGWCTAEVSAVQYEGLSCWHLEPTNAAITLKGAPAAVCEQVQLPHMSCARQKLPQDQGAL